MTDLLFCNFVNLSLYLNVMLWCYSIISIYYIKLAVLHTKVYSSPILPLWLHILVYYFWQNYSYGLRMTRKSGHKLCPHLFIYLCVCLFEGAVAATQII